MLLKDRDNGLSHTPSLRNLHYLGDLVWKIHLKYVPLVCLQHIQVLFGREGGEEGGREGGGREGGEEGGREGGGREGGEEGGREGGRDGKIVIKE